MDIQDFRRFHLPALEGDEVKFNLIIAVIDAAMKELPAGFEFWTLGEAGHCAIRPPGRAIVLGDLDRAECCELARITRQTAYPGVFGPGLTAHWFVEEARDSGAQFEAPIQQRLYVLTGSPRRPATPGSVRPVAVDDAPLLFQWMTEFHREAVPHDPPPQRDSADYAAASGRYLFWTVGERPVSVAAVVRETRDTAAIAAVYTPPHERGRGYAGSVTAAVVDRVFAQGKTAACLYADLRNPASNRCYAKIGFQPAGDAWLHLSSAHGVQ
jgi:RimJ/RimL family protein N-acetyltransferase